jgi:hypothetical protein
LRAGCHDDPRHGCHQESFWICHLSSHSNPGFAVYNRFSIVG